MFYKILVIVFFKLLLILTFLCLFVKCVKKFCVLNLFVSFSSNTDSYSYDNI